MVAKFVIFCGMVAAVSAIAVPVQNVAYSAPISYAAPLAKVAYAAPVTKIAYAAPVAKYIEQEAPANYEFQYSVHDDHSGDVKQQQESRAGDAVHGSYSLVQPDGVHRIVEYTADKVNGFNAVVRYEGHPIQAPAPAKIAYAAPAKIAYAAPTKFAYSAPISYAAPVAKVAYSAPITYSAPVAKVAYAAPVAKVAYAAAPVAKLAYQTNLGHVSFSSPVVSYSH
ncbi:cuticle protein 8-like [Melitaea cinxia]|uniref:cuticle protein 8-like n=1 Tax=Melitaea cinxia TaxID=113334 RepID=UPI001E2745A5|nr:cuticle protein 8-like [Melitaea cinxia]